MSKEKNIISKDEKELLEKLIMVSKGNNARIKSIQTNVKIMAWTFILSILISVITAFGS